MIEPGLPRNGLGRPYQPLVWFDSDSRSLGPVLDEEGHVLAWDNDTTHVEDPDSWRCQRAPEAIERATWEWWHEQDENPDSAPG